jgi:hypothetical protein
VEELERELAEAHRPIAARLQRTLSSVALPPRPTFSRATSLDVSASRPHLSAASTMRRHTEPSLEGVTPANSATHLIRLFSSVAPPKHTGSAADQQQEAGSREGGAAPLTTLQSLTTLMAASMLFSSENTGAGGSGGAGMEHGGAETHATVSLADDGFAGVGTTAAAAVSVALAQSWASSAATRKETLKRQVSLRARVMCVCVCLSVCLCVCVGGMGGGGWGKLGSEELGFPALLESCHHNIAWQQQLHRIPGGRQKC